MILILSLLGLALTCDILLSLLGLGTHSDKKEHHCRLPSTKFDSDSDIGFGSSSDTWIRSSDNIQRHAHIHTFMYYISLL